MLSFNSHLRKMQCCIAAYRPNGHRAKQLEGITLDVNAHRTESKIIELC